MGDNVDYEAEYAALAASKTPTKSTIPNLSNPVVVDHNELPVFANASALNTPVNGNLNYSLNSSTSSVGSVNKSTRKTIYDIIHDDSISQNDLDRQFFKNADPDNYDKMADVDLKKWYLNAYNTLIEQARHMGVQSKDYRAYSEVEGVKKSKTIRNHCKNLYTIIYNLILQQNSNPQVLGETNEKLQEEISQMQKDADIKSKTFSKIEESNNSNNMRENQDNYTIQELQAEKEQLLREKARIQASMSQSAKEERCELAAQRWTKRFYYGDKWVVNGTNRFAPEGKWILNPEQPQRIQLRASIIKNSLKECLYDEPANSWWFTVDDNSYMKWGMFFGTVYDAISTPMTQEEKDKINALNESAPTERPTKK